MMPKTTNGSPIPTCATLSPLTFGKLNTALTCEAIQCFKRGRSVSLADADLRQAPLGAHFLFWTRHLSAVVAHIRVPYAYTPPSRASRARSTLPCLVSFPLCRHVLTTRRVTCFFLPLHPYSTYHLTHTKVYKTRYLYSVRYLPSPKIHDTFVLSFPVRQ